MRWILVAAFAAFSPINGMAADALPDEHASVVDSADSAAGVVVSAIPAPLPVVELLRLDDPGSKLNSARKQRVAKKQPLPTMILSRTERRQVALLFNSQQKNLPVGVFYNEHGDSQGGLDALDFHRSYSRPRLIDNEATDDEHPLLSDYVRLRLLLARLKALEVHVLSQIQDEGETLPPNVVDRLKQAREMAVRAHQNKTA